LARISGASVEQSGGAGRPVLAHGTQPRKTPLMTTRAKPAASSGTKPVIHGSWGMELLSGAKPPARPQAPTVQQAVQKRRKPTAKSFSRFL